MSEDKDTEAPNPSGNETPTHVVSPVFRLVDGDMSPAMRKLVALGLVGRIFRYTRMVGGILLGGTGMLCLLLLSPLRLLHPILKLFKVPRNYLPIDFLQRLWARFMLFLFGVRVSVHYEHLVPKEKPVIVMFSHSSGLDPFVIVGHCPTSVRLVAKRSLMLVPLFGITGYLYGHIYINRGNRTSAIDSLNQAASAITDRKQSIAISPEGTRSTDGLLKPFKKGPFHLARQAGCTIVPAVIYDAYPSWPPKSPWPSTTRTTGKPVRFIFGEPVEPGQGEAQKSVEELSDAVRTNMIASIQKFEHEFAGELQ